MGTNLAFALGLPLFNRSFRVSPTKCVPHNRTYASAAASSRPAPASAASENAVPPSASANGGTFESGTAITPMESHELGSQLDLGQLTSLAEIGEITQLADEFDIADLRIECGGVTVEITRQGGRGFENGVLRQLPVPAIQPATTSNAADDMDTVDVSESVVEEEEPPAPKSIESEAPTPTDPNVVYDSDFVVKSNRVGYFFSGARNKPPLVNVGDHVAFNQPVCIIEQLGQQYVYLSEVSGTVTKIFVEDGDAVMFDDQVMVIRPD